VNEQFGYGTVAREENLGEDGVGIDGGVGEAPPGADGHLDAEGHLGVLRGMM
jgi:hypothetical protein